MLLLARTTPVDQVAKRTDGLSVFLVDMRAALGNGLTIRPIRTMINHSTTRSVLRQSRSPAENLIGEEGQGFRYILAGMNAERILIAARSASATPVVHQQGESTTPTSAWCSAGRSARTRASSSRSPRPTPNARRPT